MYGTLTVSMAIWLLVLMIFDAPQTMTPFPIGPGLIGHNRGENEFNLTLLLVFIILWKVEKKPVRDPTMSHKS